MRWEGRRWCLDYGRAGSGSVTAGCTNILDSRDRPADFSGTLSQRSFISYRCCACFSRAKVRERQRSWGGTIWAKPACWRSTASKYELQVVPETGADCFVILFSGCRLSDMDQWIIAFAQAVAVAFLSALQQLKVQRSGLWRGAGGCGKCGHWLESGWKLFCLLEFFCAASDNQLPTSYR